MTRLTQSRGPWETGTEVFDQGRQAVLVVTLDGRGVVVRQKGRRHGYTVGWSAIWWLGARVAAEQRARERIQRRAARRRQRLCGALRFQEVA